MNDPGELADDYRALGVPDEQIEAHLAQRTHGHDDGFCVWEENAPSLDMFFAVVGSWQRVGMNGCPVGLNEQAVYFRLCVLGKGRDIELYDDVIAMGSVAAEEIAERFYS